MDNEDHCDEEDRFLSGEPKKNISCDRSTAENTIISSSPCVSAFDTKLVSSFDAGLGLSGPRLNSMFSVCENISIDQPGGIFNLNQTLGSIGNSTMIEGNQSMCYDKPKQVLTQQQQADATGFVTAIKSALIFILLATVIGLLVIK